MRLRMWAAVPTLALAMTFAVLAEEAKHASERMNQGQANRLLELSDIYTQWGTDAANAGNAERAILMNVLAYGHAAQAHYLMTGSPDRACFRSCSTGGGNVNKSCANEEWLGLCYAHCLFGFEPLDCSNEPCRRADGEKRFDTQLACK